MSIQNTQTTVDDSDTTILEYNGPWTTRSPGEPNWNNNFYQQSHHATTGDGAYVRVAFVGTGIKVFAATRANHCLHSVILDGSSEKTLIDTHSDGDAFNVTIYEVHQLDYGTHEVRITNEPKLTAMSGRSVLGIDWLLIDGVPLEWNATSTLTSPASSSTAYTSVSPSSTLLNNIVPTVQSGLVDPSVSFVMLSSTGASRSTSIADGASSSSAAAVSQPFPTATPWLILSLVLLFSTFNVLRR